MIENDKITKIYDLEERTFVFVKDVRISVKQLSRIVLEFYVRK